MPTGHNGHMKPRVELLNLNGLDCALEIHVSDHGPHSVDLAIAWVEGSACTADDPDTAAVQVQLWARTTAELDIAVTAEAVRAVLEVATAELARRGIL